MSAPVVLQVVILRDGLLVGTEALVPGSYTIGSSPHADLVLDDAAVGDMHAVLYFQNGKVAVQDSGGNSGVYVNSNKVTTCEVRSIDEIQCGPFAIKARILAQKPAQPPPPAVAALLKGHAGAAHGVPPPLPSSGIASGTVASARRAQSAPHAQKPHLKAVAPLPLDEAPYATESLDSHVSPTMPRGRAPRAEPPPPAPEFLGGPLEPKRALPPRPSFGIPKPDKKGRPRLFFELYWGDGRQQARSFGKLKAKKPVVAAHADGAMMPLYGFSLGRERFVLAEGHGRTYRVYVPKKASVEQRQADGSFAPLAASQLEASGTRRFVVLANGAAVRLREGAMTLVAYVQPPLKQPLGNPFKGVPWMTLLLLIFFGTGFWTFLEMAPKASERADFTRKDLPPVALRLIAPEPKKKEAAQKRLEEIKEKAAERAEKQKATRDKVAAKRTVKPPETKALKALAKLTAAGPAMNDVLAKMDKLGGGPGLKSSNFKMSGLLGKAPIANAGLGTFGIGGGGGGGFGFKGAEILRGKGGGGIGALGAGGIGKGTVGGTVMRASARNVAVQGSIDREAVARTVNSHLQEVRACYERALLREPALAGKVVLEWTISTAGKVVSTKTKSSTLKNASVESCILQNLKGWTFPPARGGVVIVSYPFLFNSVGY